MSFRASSHPMPPIHPNSFHILIVNPTLTPSKVAKVTFNYKWYLRLKGHINDLKLNAHMHMQFSKSLCGRSDGFQIQTKKGVRHNEESVQGALEDLPGFIGDRFRYHVELIIHGHSPPVVPLAYLNNVT